VPRLALALALVLVALALHANAIALRQATCPVADSSALSCAAIVRPSLASLGPVSVTVVLLVGALVQALAALLLFLRGARLPFARDAALVAALGAGFALGLQPLAFVVTGKACPTCLAVVLVQAGLAVVLARVARGAGASSRPHVVLFALALALTGGAGLARGVSLRADDERRLSALRAAERADGRLLLVTREGCPYCEALLLEVLGDPAVLPRVERLGLRRAAPGTPDARGETEAPVLVGGSLRARGFTPELSEYEPVLEAAEKKAAEKR
jgi:hypothetical protein